MLDHKSIHAVADLACAYGEKGIVLDAVADTPLGLLVRSAVLCVNPQDIGCAEAINHLVDASRNEEHSTAMNDTVKISSDSVRRTLDLARNTVMPHLRKVIDHYQRLLEDRKPKAISPYVVETTQLPSIYKTNAGRDFLAQWDNSPAAPLPTECDLGQYGVDELQTLVLLSDVDGFNEHINHLLEAEDRKGYTQLAAVLNGTMAIRHLDGDYSLPLAIVLKNIETPKEGIKKTLGEYNTQRTLLANAAAKMAIGKISHYDNAVRMGILYDSVVKGGEFVIKVNEDVYRDLLNKGLTVEILIGNEILGRKYRGLQLLDAAAVKETTQAYERDKAARQQAHALNVREISKQAILDALREDHAEITSDTDKAGISGDSPERSWARLRDLTDKILSGIHQQAEPTSIIAAVICGTWYLHTDAWRVIDTMFSIEREQPHLPAAEIATLASIQYIAEWVVSQITHTKV